MNAFKGLAKELKGAISFVAYHLDPKKGADYMSQMRMKYKLGKKMPTLKYYPNRKVNNDKMVKSFEIYIKNSSTPDDLMEEIVEAYDHDVKEISDKLL
jgi:hypothetical protein